MIDNLFFVCLGFAIYALVNYVLSMLSVYKEYVAIRAWLEEKNIDSTSLNKSEWSKYVSLYRLSKYSDVEIVSSEEPK